MNRFDRLDLFLHGVKDRPFTVGGKSEVYVIKKFDGFGFHVEHEGKLAAVIDDFQSTPDMLVFSTEFMGDIIRKKVSIDGIQFLSKESEVAA